MKHLEYGYGFFPGGDPRKFEPDKDGNTEEELENWRQACWWADEMERRGLSPLQRPACRIAPGEGIVTLSMFGLGVYEIELDDDEFELGDEGHCNVDPLCRFDAQNRCNCACHHCDGMGPEGW